MGGALVDGPNYCRVEPIDERGGIFVREVLAVGVA